MTETNKTYRIFIYTVKLSIVGTLLIEIINWYLGYNEFNVIRELNIFLANFLIGLVASCFTIRKIHSKIL